MLDTVRLLCSCCIVIMVTLVSFQELARSNQETHKLDLMAEISNLKLRLASSDKDRMELMEKLDFAQV